MIKITVFGAAGKMGSTIINLARLDKEFEIAAAVEMPGHSLIGTGKPAISDDISRTVLAGDVMIDFSSPKASIEHLLETIKCSKPVVMGTTGFSETEISEIKAAAKKIPIVFSPNMSVGVNLLFKLAEDAAKAVPGYDMEIIEFHHNQKKDAPSGTAVKLLEILSRALGKDPKKTGVFGREGIIGARSKDEIGVMAVRAGDIVGDHTVLLAGQGERIELTHRAHSRDTLAAGALRAAKWIYGKTPGLYDMHDVLGLK
jgi:4-hydroxy-tetrahydrodipicolinate reductase